MTPVDTPDLRPDEIHLPSAGKRLFVPALIVGAVAILVSAGIGLTGDRLGHLLHTYLVSFSFCLSLSLGALFFVDLQHLTRAGWSTAVRRMAEIVAGNLPVLVILFVPFLVVVLAAPDRLFPWAESEAVEHSKLLAGKRPYLNLPFLVVRLIAYFGVWWFLSRFFLKRSCEQDASGDPELTVRMERLSAPGMILIGLTITFASFDLLMSLDPKWYSTIFGVYFFSGSAVGAIALLCLIPVLLQSSGKLKGAVSTEHYHDLGKLLFGFVFFWGYIAFSQYMLIWYGGIPEETSWYLHRQEGGWLYISLLLLFGHFIIPFLGLLSRHTKRHRPVLAFWAGWMLVMHWIDLYWLVMPGFSKEHIPFGILDVTVFIGIASLYFAGILHFARDIPLVPVRDPRLSESIAFENI